MATYSGVDVTLMIGSSSPAPVPADVTAAIQKITVVQSDEGASGFQVTFQAGKNGTSTTGYPLVTNSLFTAFNRLIVQVNVFGAKTVLMDGMILHHELQPGTTPAGSLFTVTGEDVGVMMDIEERIADYPAQDEATIAREILGTYSQYFTPSVTTPEVVDKPAPNDYLPVQHSTDWQYLDLLAERLGFIFLVLPGSEPQTNTAYWGPPYTDQTEQKAITLDLGPGTNVTGSTSIRYDALAATTVTGLVQDRTTDQITDPDITADDNERPALSANPAIGAQSHVRTTLLDAGEGRTGSEATSYAQGEVDRAADNVVQIRGRLDTTRYGMVLKTRALVGLRGASDVYDGKYYVKEVTHEITRTTYTQKFVVTREGLGSTETSVTT